MKFCINCGHQLKAGHSFCTQCGQKLEHASSGEHTQLEQQPNNQHSIHKRKMKKNTKIIITTFILLVVAAFAVHKGLQSYYDPFDYLQTLDEALTSNDLATFIENIEFEEEALLNEESYMAFIKDFEWEHVKERYLEYINAENVDQKITKIITSTNGNPLFTLIPESHVFGLYTTYHFKALPNSISVFSTMDSEVTINGEVTEQVLKEQPHELTKAYPGSYQVVATAENEYGQFTFEEDVQIYNNAVNDVFVTFNDKTYSFVTNIFDATLFINGENSGYKLYEIYEIGPFPDDEHPPELHAEWEAPNGEVLVAEAEFNPEWYGYPEITFSFDTSVLVDEKEETTSVSPEEHVLAFREAYEQALNERDYSLIEPYMLKDSEADLELMDYILNLEDSNYEYDFISNDVIDVRHVEDNIYEVMTNEIFVFINHLNEVTNYDRIKIYTLLLEEQQYKISKIEIVETIRN
ncbi:TcaA NTF2-like domain-containing protein [Bacillaceae bacterium W0354]